jgi:hypothetical protein
LPAGKVALSKRSPGFPARIAFAFGVPPNRAWGYPPFNDHLGSQLPE